MLICEHEKEEHIDEITDTVYKMTKAHLGALIMEALEEALQQLVSVVDPLGVLAHDPDHGGASIRLIQRVQILTQGGNDALVPRTSRTFRESATLHMGHYSFNDV